MLHLYALAQRPVRVPEFAGVDGSTLRRVQVGGIDAVVSDVDGDGASPAEAEILAHAQVVEALSKLNEAVLPARFERAHADEEALTQAVGARDGQLQQALARVDGCVEIGLRVLRAGAQPIDESERTGREYLLARRDEVRAAETVASALRQTLDPMAPASELRVLATSQAVLTGAFLVPRERLNAFTESIERIGRDQPGLTFVCTDPWPAYSFATVEARDE